MIQFNADTHTYTLDGTELVSISRILEDLGLVNYSGIPESVLETARKRGTFLHECISLSLENNLDETSIPEDYLSRFKGFRKFADKHNLETLGQNEIVYSKGLGVAGTLDWRGIIDGRRTIIDWKFTASLRKSVRIQLAFYRYLWNISHEPEEYIDDVLAVRIIPNGFRLPKEGFHDPDDEQRMLACLEVYNLRREFN